MYVRTYVLAFYVSYVFTSVYFPLFGMRVEGRCACAYLCVCLLRSPTSSYVDIPCHVRGGLLCVHVYTFAYVFVGFSPFW